MKHFLKNPFLPDSDLKEIIVGAAAEPFINDFNALGIKTIVGDSEKALQAPVRGHIDMSVMSFGSGLYYLSKTQRRIGEWIDFVGGKAVIADENLGYEYPLDVPFNCVIIGTDFICNSKTVSPQILGVAISRNLRIIDVKQGYTKCSLCPVRENAVITDDSGIEKVLLNNGYDVLKVSKGSVRLHGFDYGFIGGCSAMISRDILLFFGNFEMHSDKDRIKAFLQNYGITPQSLNGDVLTDIGSIIPLAGCHYVMSIPQSDDVMLMYQSTSYHDIAAIREMLGLSPIEEFKQWLEGYGIWENGHLGKNAGNPRIFL